MASVVDNESHEGNGIAERKDDRKRVRVFMDPLHVKRIHTIDENGIENVLQKSTDDDKLLALVHGLRTRGESGESDSKKEEEVEGWPWQGIMDELTHVQDELRVVLDIISHVESGVNLGLAYVGRPRLTPVEVASNLAGQLSAKQKVCQEVGKDLHAYANQWKSKLQQESEFYETLIRLQKSFKIRKTRGPSSDMADNKGFTVDLSLPHFTVGSNPVPTPLGARSLSLVNFGLGTDQSGHVVVQVPDLVAIRKLSVNISATEGSHGFVAAESDIEEGEEEEDAGENGIEKEKKHKGDDLTPRTEEEAAMDAERRLQGLQDALLDEMIFDQVEQEITTGAVSLAPVTSMDDSKVNFKLQGGSSLQIHLSQGSNPTKGSSPSAGSEALAASTDALAIFARRKLLCQLYAGPPPDPVPGHQPPLVDALLAVADHRCAKISVMELLHDLVGKVPYLTVLSGSTFDPLLSAWEVTFSPPVGHGCSLAAGAEFSCRISLQGCDLTFWDLSGGPGKPWDLLNVHLSHAELRACILNKVCCCSIIAMGRLAATLGLQSWSSGQELSLSVENILTVKLMVEPLLDAAAGDPIVWIISVELHSGFKETEFWKESDLNRVSGVPKVPLTWFEARRILVEILALRD